MVLGGTPGIVARISTVEKMGRKGTEWANMLKDELAWQDDMASADDGEEGAAEPNDATAEAAEGGGGEDETACEELAGSKDDATPATDAAPERPESPVADPDTTARAQALAKQRAEQLQSAASKSLAPVEPADGTEEGVPAVPEPEPEPEPEPVGKDRAKQRWQKIGNKVQAQEPSLSQKDADALRDLLKQLEEFDQVCAKVRAAPDKPTAKKYAARRKELCEQLAKPCADVLDVQESHYAAMHARLQRIAASLMKLEMKAAELEKTQDGDSLDERGAAQLAVLGRALSVDPVSSVAQQELAAAETELAKAELTGDPAKIEAAQTKMALAEQKVADETESRKQLQDRVEAADKAMQHAIDTRNKKAMEEAQAAKEEAMQEQIRVEEEERRLQQAREEAQRFKDQRESDIADGLVQLGGPSMSGAPPPTEAGRERLRETLEQAMKDFDANFNTNADATSCLGTPILEKVESLRNMTTADTDSVTALLVRGRDLTAEEAAELESEVTTRDQDRTTLVFSLMDELRRAQAICTALMQAAKLYLEAERARVAGERLAALEAIQQEQEMLMDATKRDGASPGGQGSSQPSLFRSQEGQLAPEPGSLEELNAMVVPKEEMEQQKKQVQDEFEEASRAVAEAEDALTKLRTDEHIAKLEQSAGSIAAAEQRLAEAKQKKIEREEARKKTRDEHAALIDSKTAMKLTNAGATKNAQGLALLIGLLRERLEELQTLPKLEKEARKCWRKTRRAEKATVRITLMLRSLRNRHDEAIEFGQISSESDDDDLLYDDDFDLANPEEVKAKMETLSKTQLEKAQFIEQSRGRLRELSVALPELRFDLREPPRTERSEFDDEAPGGMYD